MRRNVSRSGVARKQRHQRFAIKSWVDKLVDVPAFILGNGPSLKDVNLSLIENFFSIGINRAYLLLDPTILIWQDISLWNTEYHRLHNTQALKVARDIADPRRIYYNFYLKGGSYKFDKTKTHILFGRGSTGPIAVQLAVAIGCRPIVLLGMDCKTANDGSTNFYGVNNHYLPHTLNACASGLQFIKEQCPVEVRSASNNDFFPREKLEDILSDIDPDLKYSKGRTTYIKMLLNV